MITKELPRPKETPGLKWKIFLIDDHLILREGVRRLLETEGNFIICGEASAARGAVAEIKKAAPDLLIIDISLPGIDGIDLIKILKVQMPNLCMLVLSMHDETLYAERALRAGAMGYVMKQSSPQELLRAVEMVMNNEIYLNGPISSQILQSVVRKGNKGRSALECLTDRELRILHSIGEGFTTAEIGTKFGISRKTVESHRGNIRKKLGLQSGAELIRFALSHRVG